jgi:tryptophan-rich sensory protein
MKKQSVLSFLYALVLCFAAAALGSVFTMPAIATWYATITKPVFSPPNWIFGPVWTVLYICMAIALWFVWNIKTKKKEKAAGVKYFYVQLALNSLWSILFFGLHNPSLAVAEIIVLWIMIYLTIRNFFAVSQKAGWLLIPYLVWVSFATVLNFSVALLNF